jgi:hypothetical protein
MLVYYQKMTPVKNPKPSYNIPTAAEGFSHIICGRLTSSVVTIDPICGLEANK